MSTSDADPVLVTTDPVISHEVPVPVEILKDVSNLGSNETPDNIAAGLVSLDKADASNGAVGPTTSADEKENVPSHEKPVSVGDGVFVDDKEAIIHGSGSALEKTEGVQDAPVVEVDNAASDSITTDNVDDTTLNEKDNEIIAVKDIPSTLEVESVATVEHGTPADSDLIAPIANITETNTIDDSMNDSAIEFPLPVLDKKQGRTKDNEDDAVPADGVKLAETGNHNEAAQMDKRDATDSVDGIPEIMNQAPNGETLAIAGVALQEEGIDVDIPSSAAEGDALDIDTVPETQQNASTAMAEVLESNVTDSVVAQVDAADVSVEAAAAMKDNLSLDHIESAAAASEAVVETQDNEPKAIVEDIVEQTQGEDAPAVAEEQVPVVEVASTEADLKEDGAVVATETAIAVESNDAGVTTQVVEQGEVDETSAEPMNNLGAEPLIEEVEVGHEVEPAAEDVNIEQVSSHEEPVRSAVEEESNVAEVAVRVIEEIPDTGEGAEVAVDETTEAPETVDEPTNDTEAIISTLVEAESISSEANIVPEVEVTYEEGRPAPEVESVVANESIAALVDEVPTIPEEGPVDAGAEVEEVSAPVKGESVPASEEITAPVDASDTIHEAASVPVEEEVVPASAAIAEPDIESEEVVPTAEDVETVTPETINEEASAKAEVELVTADEEVIAAPAVATEAVAKVGNEQVETKPIATPVDEPIAPVAESEVPREGAAACVEAEPLPASEVITISVIESEEVAQTSDDVGAAAAETSVETYEEVPATIEVQHEVENIAEETTASVLAKPVAETEGATEKASEVETAGHDDVTQEAPGSVEPEAIPTSDEVAATVVEVAAEPVPVPIELSEETFTTTVNVENEEILASVDGLDGTTVVEAESAPIQAPVGAAVAASFEEEHDVTGEAATASGDSTAPTTQVVDEASPPSIHAPDADSDTVAEAQATHSETPDEIALDTSTAVAEGEAIAEESPALAVEVAEEIVTTAGQGDDVAVEESTSAPVVESVPVKENVPELRTGGISIETSLDTTPFTPVLDSGIGFKEQDPAPSILSIIAEEPISSWRPSSFQISTVGGAESSGVGDAGPVPDNIELAETGEPASVPLLVVEETPVNEQAGASEDFVSVDQPSLEQPPRPWAASYSVHSQGSPTRVELAENFSIDEPVPTHELKEPATAAHDLLLEEQGESANIPVEEGFTAGVINHNVSATSTAGSHVPPTEEADQVSPADLTEVNLEFVGNEDANENADEEANQEVEAKLTTDDAPARPWTHSYSTHSQVTLLVATKELEDVPPASVISDVALSAERGVDSHAENAIAVDSEHDNTVEEQISTTENEVHGQPSTEVSHVNPVITLEGHEIEDETLNPQQNSRVETNANHENELPRPWTPSFAVHSQGSPVAVPKDFEEAPLDAELIEQSIPESTAATSFPIDAQEITHFEPLTAEFDKGKTPSSVEQSQNNIGGVVSAAIAPAIALAAFGAGIRSLGPVADGEAPQVDATLTVDTTVVPLLSVPSDVVDGDATDTIVDALERPRSPWTPSYSVTKQGAGLSQEEEAEVDHLEPLPPAATQVATTSDSEPHLNEVQEDDPPSNALQTRPSYTVAGTEEIAKNEQFFLFGLRAIVAYLWVLPKWLSMTPSDHSRQGSSSSSSSSSSKFFPGGWFTPKPNEGSTSLDVAQGEFAATSKVTTSNDVFETLGSEATNSSVPINVVAEDEGRKRKWCVVM